MVIASEVERSMAISIIEPQRWGFFNRNYSTYV